MVREICQISDVTKYQQTENRGNLALEHIFHKNREISILMMKKKPTAMLTLLQEATERNKLGKTKTNNKQKNKKQWYE
jgi:hypothetical protein